MKLSLTLGALTAVQIGAAFAVQLIVLRSVGAGTWSDAFIAAQTVPLLILSVLGTPLQLIWQSRLAIAVIDRHRWPQEQALAQGQVLLLIGGALLIAATTSPYWLHSLFSRIVKEAVELTVELTRVLCTGAVLSGLSLLLTSALRARGKFIISEAVSAFIGVIAVGAAWWWVPLGGVLAAAWIITFRSLAVFVCLLVATGFPVPSLRVALSRHETWKALGPMLAGASLYKLGPLVDRYWAARAPAGGLTAYGLCQTAVGALAQLIERAVCMPATPALSRLATAKRYTELKALLLQRIIRVTAIVGALGLGLLAIHPFWSGWLTWALHLAPDSSESMWWLCILLLGYLHVAASGSLLVAAFVAIGDSQTPARVGSIAFIFSVILKSAGFMVAGLGGLAAATSIYYVINLLTLTTIFWRRLEARAA